MPDGGGLYLMILRHEVAGPVETHYLQDGATVPAHRRFIGIIALPPEKADVLELLAYGVDYDKALAVVPSPEFIARDVPRLLIHRRKPAMPVSIFFIHAAARVPSMLSRDMAGVARMSSLSSKRFATLIDVVGESVVFLGLGDTGYERAMKNIGTVRTLLRAKGDLRA